MFPTANLCEAAMSALVNIKAMYRNRLTIANDKRMTLSIGVRECILLGSVRKEFAPKITICLKINDLP